MRTVREPLELAGQPGRQGRGYRQLQTQEGGACLTLIVACIIYWQAREMSLAVRRGAPQAEGVDLSMLKHVSPIEWNNVVLYGQYVINLSRIRPRAAVAPPAL